MSKQILKWFTPGDELLILFLLALSAFSLWLTQLTAPEGIWAEVFVQGKAVAQLPLNENRYFEVQGPLGVTVISIHENRVTIESSACPHKLCTQMGPVSRVGQLLVCVPNQVVVQVRGNRASFELITE